MRGGTSWIDFEAADRYLPIPPNATFSVFASVQGTGCGTNRAKRWDAPIPTTPNPVPNLRLREPGRLDGGFAVDGDWQMQDWSFYWRDSFLSEWRQRRSGVGASR